MAAITITLASSCASQGHVVLNVTGDKTATVRIAVDEVFAQPLDGEALQDFLRMVLKIYSVGKTKAQMRTGLLAGLTVVI